MAKSYVATEQLFVGTALAHDVGDDVPAANVEPNGWQDGVKAVTAPAADSPQK